MRAVVGEEDKYTKERTDDKYEWRWEADLLINYYAIMYTYGMFNTVL